MADVALDFGTSTTLAASRRGQELPQVLSLGQGASSMPSVARYQGDGLLVGEAAMEALPARELIRWCKIGITKNVYRLDELGFPVQGTVDETVIAILSEAVRRTQRELKKDGSLRVNISCPSGWSWAQRERLLAAAAAAGVDTRGSQVLIDEPVAAGAGWAEWRRSRGLLDDHSRTLVVDVGGGTLDVAVVDVDQTGGGLQFRVLASKGVDLGGYKVDELIALHLAGALGLDDAASEFESGALQRTEAAALLLRAAEDAKRILSRVDAVPVDIPSLTKATTTLTSDQVSDLTSAYVNSIIHVALGTARQGLLAQNQRTLEVMKSDWGAMGITDVLLVGGGSRLRGIAMAFRKALPEAELSTEADYIAAEEMVVRGLTFPEEFLSLCLDRPHFSIGVMMDGESTSLYDAYDPLYETQYAVLNDRPAVRKRIGVHRSSKIELVFQSVTGERMLPANDVNLTFDLKPGTTEITSTFYTDGTLRIRSIQQDIVHVRIPDWDPLRKDFEIIPRPAPGPMGHFADPFEEGAPG